MSSLKELTEAYLNAKAELEQAKDTADIAKGLLMTELENVGLKSIKTEKATVSIVKKPVYSLNQRVVEQYLKEQPNVPIDEFYITTMDKSKVLQYAEHQLKSTGEVIPGIEASETEYLTVRKIKEEEK